ncbi:cbb3-type cytochrome c oxidase subunit I [Fodinisporobacter ferrooxydans]|uniref:Cbb3-type cytochrome c oxidase subunit I n=1 Tax=Fodinisporobacter ferrooxydans TaxID=2901836 RepID=A0ABY4CH39_9BACL|nr:cbb3-type cytochrome c oxidase subunit I [Alicyclobacillaceae bacterium MYW30-H2]
MSTMTAMEPEYSVPFVAKKRMPPVLRGFLWAAVGFLVFNTLISETVPTYGHPFVTELSVTIGWVAALVGWILGIGTWEAVVKPAFGIATRWAPATGWRRYLEYSTDHKVIGIQYVVASTGGFFIAGFAAMLMRVELMKDQMWLFQLPQQYLTTVGIHGTIMMFSVGTVALVGGLGNYIIPLMIGSNTSAFPKMSGISLWLVPAGILTVAFSPLLGYWTTGWRGYQPLATQDASGIIFYYLGVFALTLSSLLVSINLTATIIFKRAPGLTWNRLPIFAWGMLTVSLLNLIWLPEIMMTFILSLLAHVAQLPLFTAVGSPLTYMELFWLFGHPEVYIVVVPGFALWQEILPVMSRKSLFAEKWGVIGLVFVMALSGMVWAHHMFTNMRNDEMMPFSFFTEMISIPTGFAFMVVIGTLWKSKLRLTTPTIFILMSMFNFLIGGLTGVFLADPVINLQEHDTFFIVGHFHYTIIGGMVFSWLGAMYYWLPKLSGRMYNEKLGVIGAIWVFLTFNITFTQFFILGMKGMNRWVPVYMPYLQNMNFEVSIFAVLLGLGFLYNAIVILHAWRRGPKAEKNPWGGKTLEWYSAAPEGTVNFPETPRVVGSFYVYGDESEEAVVLPGAAISQR